MLKHKKPDLMSLTRVKASDVSVGYLERRSSSPTEANVMPNPPCMKFKHFYNSTNTTMTMLK